VVGEKGEQLGVMPLLQAKEIARRHNLDLVEVAPTAVPPVCRLLDYGKYKYEQTKKERETRKSQRVSLLKEVRMRPKIGEHDFAAKLRLVKKLIEEGDKVKVTILFRGREVTHPDIGWKLLMKMAELLNDVASLSREAVLEGKRMNIILSPLAGARTKNVEKVEVKEA